jgi:hypothetical protein
MSLLVRLALRRRQYSTVPWFVDPTESLQRPKSQLHEQPKPPTEAPEALKVLHRALAGSPFLEPSTLLTTRPKPAPVSIQSTILERPAHGTRRKRGGVGEATSDYEVTGALWSWMMIAQVCNGRFWIYNC